MNLFFRLSVFSTVQRRKLGDYIMANQINAESCCNLKFTLVYVNFANLNFKLRTPRKSIAYA